MKLEMKMSQSEVESYARSFLKEAYNMELSIPVVVNPRLSRALGRFLHTGSTRKPVRIEVAQKYLVNGNLEDIQQTIKHECIHYALYVLDKPYKDGHEVFESELSKHGSHSTKTISLKVERNVNVYKCDCTSHKSIRALKNEGKYHSCKNCKSYLTFVGKRLMAI